MQRLFSNFAGGWPGVGLLILRLLTGTAIIYSGIGGIIDGQPRLIDAVQSVAVVAGIFLSIGLFTPVAGVLAAIAKGWVALWRFTSHSGEPWMAVTHAILAAVLLMIGPGAWSIDARWFGRKHIELSDR